VADFIRAVEVTEPTALVPSCPGWSARDLVVHIGDVHRWAAAAITEGRSVDRGFQPGPDDDLAQWYRDSGARLIEAIESTPLDADIWTFGQAPHRVAFWSRRQLHETVVHLWDIDAVTGARNRPIADRIAVDGVDEVCSVMYPRQARLNRIPELTHTVGLDTGTEVIILGPGSDPDATVAGSAPDLLLLVWRRLGLDAGFFEIDGDVEAVRTVFASAITP
jgi:uncharacterized protein (TIGR03083 family)